LNLRKLDTGDRVWLSDGTTGRVSNPPYDQTFDIDYVRVDLDVPGEQAGRLFNMRGEHCLGFLSHIVKVVRAPKPKAKPKPKPKSRKKYAWRVVVHCRSRAHAREALANIDDGLRNLSIERIEV
jgi:hypothetical protein